MALDLSGLADAVASLGNALEVADHFINSGKFNKNEIDVIKAGVIQNFEFTYELCWKFMKRWLDINHSESFTAGITRKQLFRYAAENLLIEDFDRWLTYHELRNKTSHTYDGLIAAEIFNSARQFHGDAKAFLKTLKEKND
ncbi:MAG: HI0074 family nucleotidyltransferase substrate-binding subunit [Candidatus Wallbacteria bacterium]